MCSEDVGVNKSCCEASGTGVGITGSREKTCSRELFMCLEGREHKYNKLNY